MATITPETGNEETNWPPPVKPSDWIMPPWRTTIARGIAGLCPHCGKSRIFSGYLKVNASCAACAAPLGRMPADDTPLYIAMLLIAHITGLFIVFCVRLHFHPNAPEIAFLLLLLLLTCLGVLRLAKGATIGILLKLDTNREPPNA